MSDENGQPTLPDGILVCIMQKLGIVKIIPAIREDFDEAAKKHE